MATALHTEKTWQRITSLAAKARRNHVAVAYFGAGASRLLPLKAGDKLVVDMSEGAVKAGQTCPEEVLKLVQRGVSAYSVHNLHAKVFVLGDRAIVGSANASNHSAETLIEAAVETSDAQAVAACRRFVQSHFGEILTPEFLMQMQRLYTAPKVKKPKRPDKPGTVTPLHAPTWVVPLATARWDPKDEEEVRRGTVQAKRQIRDKNLYEVDRFIWEGPGYTDCVKAGHLVFQIVDEGQNHRMVAPMARVVHVRRYRVGKTHRAAVFLEMRSDVHRKNLKYVFKKLGRHGRLLRKVIYTPRLLRDHSLVHGLLRLWPAL